ncbi:hypothetical protein BGZ89_005222 [Linnemannia elongata]|nr:hypothetical protein BGZ89_005222 [Linnemannia elongata]
MRRSTLAAFIPALIAILAAHNPVSAQADPVMEYCAGTGCSSVVTLLNPCGGGASNSSLQQDFTYTVTPDLGSCECNSQFFNALSSCLGCPTNNQAGFNTYNNYQHDEYPSNGGYSDYDQQNYYGSGQNGDDSMAMSNLQHSNYIPPPMPMSPSAVAAVASATGGIQRPLGEPRPSDQFPQSLRPDKEWDSSDNTQRHSEYTSDLISNDHLLYNDKAVIEDDDEGVLEPPRARDRYRNDRDDFTQRRSMTPPRANMQSYRDEFTRPSFDREPRRNSGSERGSISGLRVAAGAGSGYNSQDESSEGGLQSGRLDLSDSPESARRRRAAELFSAEGTRR